MPDLGGGGFLEMLLWLQPEQRFRPNEGLFSVSIFGSCFSRFWVSIWTHFVTLYGALGAYYRQSGVSLGALDILLQLSLSIFWISCRIFGLTFVLLCSLSSILVVSLARHVWRRWCLISF